MAGELSKVLDHVEKIRELDLRGVEATSHVVDIAGVVRADTPRPSLPVEVALAGAPERVEIPAPTGEGTWLGFGVPSPGQEPGE